MRGFVAEFCQICILIRRFSWRQDEDLGLVFKVERKLNLCSYIICYVCKISSGPLNINSSLNNSLFRAFFLLLCLMTFCSSQVFERRANEVCSNPS